MALEDSYQVSILDENLSANAKRELINTCKDLIVKAGGTVRENLYGALKDGYISFTLPEGVENPIKAWLERDSSYKDKIYTCFWAKCGIDITRDRAGKGNDPNYSDEDEFDDPYPWKD